MGGRSCIYVINKKNATKELDPCYVLSVFTENMLALFRWRTKNKQMQQKS